jgi:predicted dehydrogenase
MAVRIIQAGLGNRGGMWAELIAAHPLAAHAAAVDPDPARRTAFAGRFPGVVLFESLDEAVASVRADAVLLATPPDGHRAQCAAAVAARLPILAEKPLSLDAAEAEAIVREAETASVPLTVGLNFRYLPVTIAKRRLIAKARFGAPGFGQMTYLRNRDGRAPHLNKYPLAMRHPMMLEQTIHHLDLIRFVYAREVVSVTCRSWNPPWSMYAHDSNVACLLVLEGGLEVSYLGTWTGGWNALQFSWRTDCPGGVIVQRALFDDLAVARTDDAALTPVPLAPCEPFRDDTRALLDAFVAAVRSGGTPPCTGRDHLRTLAVCFAAIRSSETGRTVELAPFMRETMPAAYEAA